MPISLLKTTDDGEAKFRVNNTIYEYEGIDGIIINKIRDNTIGKALNLAKKYCIMWRREDEKWKGRKEK